MITSSELASSAVRFFERAIEIIPATARAQSVAKIDLSPARVRALLTPLTPDETRRMMVRQVRPQSCGRGGLPGYAVRLMFEDYQRLGSLAKVGKLHGRTRQAMYDILKSHRLPLNKKFFWKKKFFKGRAFTPGKDGYYRATSGDRMQLHYAIWKDAHGPIPDGHQVTFKNADRTDFSLDNLACMPIREVTLFHHRRHVALRES